MERNCCTSFSEKIGDVERELQEVRVIFHEVSRKLVKLEECLSQVKTGCKGCITADTLKKMESETEDIIDIQGHSQTKIIVYNYIIWEEQRDEHQNDSTAINGLDSGDHPYAATDVRSRTNSTSHFDKV